MVLLMCLIFLMSLTLIGLSASSDTVLQNQLSANLQEAERARQSALSALSWAEKWLLELSGTVPEYCTKPCLGQFIYSTGELAPHPESEDLSWWQDHGHEVGVDPSIVNTLAGEAAGNINKPIWIIEVLHTIPASEENPSSLQTWYRILARGSGRTKAAVSVIESTVMRSWSLLEDDTLTNTDDLPGCAAIDSTTKCGRVAWRELR
jgi:Tfp pilus assembly protein PilX